MKDGKRGPPIESYGKKGQNEWIYNTLLDLHSCTAGNKEEEHIISRSSNKRYPEHVTLCPQQTCKL